MLIKENQSILTVDNPNSFTRVYDNSNLFTIDANKIHELLEGYNWWDTWDTGL